MTTPCDGNKIDNSCVLPQDDCITAQINGPVTIHNQVQNGIGIRKPLDARNNQKSSISYKFDLHDSRNEMHMFYSSEDAMKDSTTSHAL